MVQELETAQWSDIQTFVAAIVGDAVALCERASLPAPWHVSYCALFAQSASIYTQLDRVVSEVGIPANATPTGTVFVIPEITTAAGPLRILKVRRPDESRPERGDADFRIDDYQRFKRSVVDRAGFSVIVRDEFEMVELVEDRGDVRAYFSSPPVEQHGNLPDVLRRFGYH